MGILNVTPDSFAGDALHDDVGARSERAREFVAAGADVLDIGGESTRPNAQPVDAREEMARVLPALRAVCAAVDVPVSIDTRKAEVAAAAIAEGAVIVNDVWGLRGDPAMVDVLAANPHVALVAMHNQRGTEYGDLMQDICAALRESVRIAQAHGVSADRIVVDPGFGFGKTAAQNLELMRRLRELRGLGRPVLLGPSRKHTVGAILGGLPPSERVEGTLALLALAVEAGVSMVRVHDVAAAVRAVSVADAVVRGTPPDDRRAARAGPDRVTTDVAWVALGSNLGNRGRALAALREHLSRDGVVIEAASSEILTRPIGVTGQGDFHNQLLRLRAPQTWSAAALAGAHARGRAGRRPTRHLPLGPAPSRRRHHPARRERRDRGDEPGLVVPHPEIANRPFIGRLLKELGR